MTLDSHCVHQGLAQQRQGRTSKCSRSSSPHLVHRLRPVANVDRDQIHVLHSRSNPRPESLRNDPKYKQNSGQIETHKEAKIIDGNAITKQEIPKGEDAISEHKRT